MSLQINAMDVCHIPTAFSISLSRLGLSECQSNCRINVWEMKGALANTIAATELLPELQSYYLLALANLKTFGFE